MSRIVSVWLPRWPILRFLAAQAINPAGKPIDPERPFVLAVAATGGPRIAALNVAAENAGLAHSASRWPMRAPKRIVCKCAPPTRRRRCRAAPACSMGDALHARPPRLGTRRTAPTAFFSTSQARRICSAARKASSPILPPGLIASACRRGLPSPIRPAWPGRLSRFHAAAVHRAPVRARKPHALAPLPIEALAALGRKPRSPAAARLQIRRRADRTSRAHLLRRAFPPSCCGGSIRRSAASTSRSCRSSPPPVYHSLRYLLEPIVTQEAIVASRCRLMKNLVHVLVRDDVGARALATRLYRVDGAVETLDIGLTAADAQCGACGAPDRSQARSACRDASMPASASRQSALPSRSPSHAGAAD